jgi:hypothetical protein
VITAKHHRAAGMVARWFSTTVSGNAILIMDSEGHELSIAKCLTEEISKLEFFKEQLRGNEIPPSKVRKELEKSG